MMIKHQEELVNVTNLDCPLHKAELDNSEIKKRLHKGEQEHILDIPQPLKDCFDDNLIKSEVICLCEDKAACQLTAPDEDERFVT